MKDTIETILSRLARLNSIRVCSKKPILPKHLNPVAPCFGVQLLKLNPKIILLAIAMLTLTGCSNGGSFWLLEYRPITPQERTDMEALVLKMVGNNPRELSGHDQDWDDAIDAARRAARESCCEPRLFEYAYPAGFMSTRSDAKLTGRWKRFTNPEPAK